MDWNSSDNVFTEGPTDTSGVWRLVSDATGDVQGSDLSPSGTYTLTFTNGYLGMGRWYGGNVGVVHRGGYRDNGVNAGVFTLFLNPVPAYLFPHVGFRCVYRP